MPVQPNPQPIDAWPRQANIPATGMFVTVQLQNDGSSTAEQMDAALQSVIDHLQSWPGKLTDSDVTGQIYQTLLYGVTPTIPDEPGE
jgi:hypothetical protein